MESEAKLFGVSFVHRMCGMFIDECYRLNYSCAHMISGVWLSAWDSRYSLIKLTVLINQDEKIFSKPKYQGLILKTYVRPLLRAFQILAI